MNFVAAIVPTQFDLGIYEFKYYLPLIDLCLQSVLSFEVDVLWWWQSESWWLADSISLSYSDVKDKSPYNGDIIICGDCLRHWFYYDNLRLILFSTSYEGKWSLSLTKRPMIRFLDFLTLLSTPSITVNLSNSGWVKCHRV